MKKIAYIQETVGRYVITDATTGVVIDNAQGYEFSSHIKAENFAVSHGWIVVNTYESELPTSESLF